MKYNDIPESHWYTIHLIELICASLTLYVTIKTLIKSFDYFNYRLRVIQRLPIYISINYLLLSFFHSIDHFISLTTSNPISNIGCNILGFLVDISIYNNCIMIAFMAYIMWKTIIFKNHVKMGTYDWKLLLPSIIVIIIYVSIGNYDNIYGYAFCQHKNTLIYYGIPILISYIICIFFWGYLMIYLFIYSRIKIRSYNNFDEQNIESQNKVKKFVFKIPQFILIYIIEWLPYLVTSIYVHYNTLSENLLFGLILLSIICIMLGGFIFTITYEKILPY